MIRQEDKLRDYQAQGLLYANSDPVLELGVQEGSLRHLTDDAIAVSREIEDLQKWKLGDKVDLWLSDGKPATLRIVAIYTLSRGFGDFVLPGKLVVAHSLNGLASSVFVQNQSGGDVSAAANSLAELEAKWPMLDVSSRSTAVDKTANAISS